MPLFPESCNIVSLHPLALRFSSHTESIAHGGYAAHRSAFDEATKIRLINGQSTYSLRCPRPSQTADQRFGNIWSDNILSSLLHWLDINPSDFPRIRMRDDCFDERCFHTMVNAAGRVAARSRRKTCTKGRDAQSLV